MSEAIYHYGVWFVPGDGKDYFAKLVRRDGRWRLEYRFRYYSGSRDPFDGKDVKNHWVAIMADDSDESLAKAIRSQTDIAAFVEANFGGHADFVLLECTDHDPKFFFELASRPWAHTRKEPQ